MNEKDQTTIERTIYLLLALFFLMFLSGFLKNTPFEHTSIALFLLLFLFGIILLGMTIKKNIKSSLKLFLVLTSIATSIYMLLILSAIITSILSNITLSNTLEAIEGLFYLTSALFLIGVAGSITLIKQSRSELKNNERK